MSTDHSFAGMTLLGDAVPFVPRIQEIVQTIRLFEDFDHDDIELLARHMRVVRAVAGTEIIREGEEGDYMILILNGSCEIVRRAGNALETHIATVGPGKTIGEMALIDGEPRFACCRTLETVDFAVLDREQLSLMITESPMAGVKLLMEFLVQVNQRLRNTTNDLVACLAGRGPVV